MGDLGRADGADDEELDTVDMVAELFYRRRSTIRRCRSLTTPAAADTKSPLPLHFCDELLFEILIRLPVKDANRCKCISKHWYDSISSPYFARRYTVHRRSSSLLRPPPVAVFFQYRDTLNWEVPTNQLGVQSVHNDRIFNSPGFSLSFLATGESQPPVRFLASNNGLVLCCATRFFQKLYYVCNPLTKQWVALPPPPTCRRVEVRLGFICSEIGGGFRVVRVQEFESKGGLYADLKLEIFASETGQWTESVFTGGDQPCFHHGQSSAVVCDGMIHWGELCLDCIFAFDPYKIDQQYRTIDLPPKGDLKRGEYYTALFGESQGCLRYARYNYKAGTFTIWEYHKEGSKWCLLHHFNKSQIVSSEEKHSQLTKYTTNYCDHMTLLAFHPMDGDVMFLGFPGRIIECNMRSRSLRPFCSLAHGSVVILKFMLFPYVLPWWPTLVPN